MTDVTRHWLRLVYAWDRLRFVGFRLRHGGALRLERPVSPNLRHARLRLEPGAELHVAAGFATERQPGNQLWIQARGRLELGRNVWLRTEYGPNRFTVFPEARLVVGARGLINGAMLHAKREIVIGDDCRLGFGVRVIDADLHDVDGETPERIEPVHIGDRVWIGADAKVLRGVSIGDDVVVGAGSIVTRDLPPRVLAVGAPARPVREIASRSGCS